MSYSIFYETMADMTYTEISKAAERNLPVLFPIAVIEEHGPHMCLGTDTYLTYSFCKKLKKELTNNGVESLIAPPFYWGINSITNAFPGSFVVKAETMMTILIELLDNFKRWGFNNIFLFNFHGDYQHIQTIYEVVKKSYNEHNIGVHFIAQDLILKIAGLSREEPYIIEIPTCNNPITKFIDVHTGSFETSWMVKDFPKVVDINKAKKLELSTTTVGDLNNWLKGGAKAKEITPLGYCGNPSEIDTKKAEDAEYNLIKKFAEYIINLLKV